jgi:hypothetical protein
MYRHFLKLLSAICLLFTFWPVLRFHNITIFDWLTPILILCALPYAPKERGAPFSAFALATSGIAVLSLAGIISVGSSYDSNEHILQVFKLVFALSGIVGLAYVLENRKILTVAEALSLLCLSATVSSAVCILQGQFGMLTDLMPKAEGQIGGRVEAWTRMTGLTEWPIEAGNVSDFGIIIGLGLALYTRKWFFYLPLVAIGLYSMTDSASLTAFFALIVAFGMMCLHAKAYKAVVLGIAVGICGLALASMLDARRLTERLQSFSQSQGNYATVQSREMQWAKSLEMIGPRTLLVGNGYSALDLPFNMEIHNGVIASVFHFGILGLVAQSLLIAFFAVRLRQEAPRTLKSILLGCLIIFAFAYLTGPALSRRSLWVTPMVLGAYLTTLKAIAPSRSRRAIGGLNLRSKRELPSDV